MKKKLAILLAAVMVAAMVPVSAFATSTNYLTGQAVTVTKDTVLTTDTTVDLAIEDNKGDIANYLATTDAKFELNLSNAEWTNDFFNYPVALGTTVVKVTASSAIVTLKTATAVAGAPYVVAANVVNTAIQADASGTLAGVLAASAGAVVGGAGTGDFEFDAAVQAYGAAVPTATSAQVKAYAAGLKANLDQTNDFGVASHKYYFPLLAKITAEAEATVTISPVGTCPVASGTYTFAVGASGSTTISIEKTTTLSEAATEIKPISIVETAPGTLKNTEVITLKCSKDFKFTNSLANPIVVAQSYGSATLVLPVALQYTDQEIKVTVANVAANQISKVVISGLDVIAKDSADEGDICEITVSGAGTTKTTVEAGPFAEYGYTFVVEDKTLPVFYSGTVNDNDTLKVTFKESVLNSWVASRKTTFTFPEGVKVSAVTLKKVSNVNNSLGAALTAADFVFDENKATITGCATTGKAEVQIVFELSVSPEYTGDITVTCGGSAVEKDTELVIATAAMPFTVEVDINEVNIDYRNVAVGDITIKEAYAGALESGKVLELMAENMDFEKGFTWEVTEGDIDIEDITEAGGFLDIDVDSESAKTPATIVISNLELYLDRTLPAGDYSLSAVYCGATDAFFQNYNAADTDPNFDVDEVVVADAYVRIVTAGRDQDDSTFTTQISVPVGAYEISCGTSTIAIDTPAFINEAGYTMMPLRGVVEALSGTAIVSWDDATRTVTILFGSRVISMTIGTKAMVINGTSIAMTSAPEIVNSRTFLPLRDLGYALGLADSKIAWDDTTKTATLN